MTSSDILEDAVFETIFDEEDPIERVKLETRLAIRAKELGVRKEFDALLRAYKKDSLRLQKKEQLERAAMRTAIPLDYDEKGAPQQTIRNFTLILDGDPIFDGKFWYNEFANRPERQIDGRMERWQDEDDSWLRAYIEQKYQLYHEKKLADALRIKFSQNKYHPVRSLIQSLAWDGKNRIETLLIRWLGVEDTPYAREVSRMLFAGGIHRIFDPGCKFDDMPVLIGAQGGGKSTFIRWLAMDDQFYREVTEIDGQRGIESIEGAWICEMGELLALKRTKDIESVKSYISRQVDSYRQPFDKRVTDRPRQCVFIGTTNNMTFLTDKTGNRRYYPLMVTSVGGELFDHAKEVQADIRQCWAEAYHRMLAGDFLPVANRDLRAEIRAKQDTAVEDDYRIGMIESYLEDHDIVCILDLWENALGEIGKPTKKDSNEIALIMQEQSEWEKTTNPRRFAAYGRQRAWVRKQLDLTEDGLLPF